MLFVDTQVDSHLSYHRRNQWRHVWIHHRFGHDVGWLQLEDELPLVCGSTERDWSTEWRSFSPTTVFWCLFKLYNKSYL